MYNDALFHAAIGGHEAIINLLLDLGAENKRGEILSGASVGGNLDLVIKQNVHDSRGHLSRYYEEAIGNASLYNNLNVLKYLLSLKGENYKNKPPRNYPNYGIFNAGMSGNQEIINYLIICGANNYVNLVEGASNAGYLDIVRNYIGQEHILPGDLEGAMDYAFENGHNNVIEYLESLGVTRTSETDEEPEHESD
jgi:hypothetical protein